MRVLSLDFDPLYGDEEDIRSTFSSDRSAFDFDLVVWDPHDGLDGYAWSGSYRGLRSLNENSSVAFNADIDRRRKEFREYVESGRNLVVISQPPQAAYYDTGERKYSGTGRNQSATRVVAHDVLQRAIPVKECGFEKARGTRVEIVGDGPIQRLLRKYENRVDYAATMTNAPGIPIAKVAGTSRVVSSLLLTQRGGVLLVLPFMDFEVGSSDGEFDGPAGADWTEDAAEFVPDLIDALAELNGATEIARPSWADSYTTTSERKLRADVTKAKKSVERARTKLAGLQQKVGAVELGHQLYLGTGRTLELRVREVLELLGGVVSEPEHGRDDWRVEFPEGKAVVEVKGVTKSAAEKHAAQLEKWAANALQESGEVHKGILVVNTWRELPLAERKEQDFPTQMIKYSTSREHCLTTGLQLFVIKEQIESGDAAAEAWRKKILATNGRLEDVPDWRTYIALESLQSDSEED
ncbi:hypothetical protein PZ938_02405 [Luteipulveratus sp. YIM 133132]|uniref:hypothetical protein n=1 Tax=Luteipulveratus flavus TaxID=3031728 RepID=UPI0023AEB4D4|nr:hypothetical protein [Luteipulveratus sp. YIM 133132]MDE9364446.1 hypothetical protein [Luteipulveratus sp. YIM 133132]